jgi:multiple sugar transport system permease protein
MADTKPAHPPLGGGRTAAADVVAGGRSQIRRNERRAGLLFVAPFALLFLAMFLVPLGYALYTSLFREQLVGGTVFAGLANYRQALTDPQLRSGVLRMLRFGLIQVPVMLGFALLCALALDSGRLRWPKVFRIGIFLPYAVPSVIAALMWGYLYGPTFGPFAQIARGVEASAPGFLTESGMLASLANVVTWEFTGYNAIVLYAALRAIPPDLYEAAAIDGAGPIRIAWHIKIPAIVPALVLTLVFSVIGTLQLFNEPQIFTALAPDVIGNAYTPNLYAYTLAFTNQQYGYSAAISFTLGAVIVVMSYAVILASARRSGSRS